MKGIVSGIKRMAVHDGEGLRTTVFLKGCPLKCIWCHNPESISFQEEVAFFREKCIDCGFCRMQNPVVRGPLCPNLAKIRYGEEWEALDLTKKLLMDRSFWENSGGGVTFSGGECLSQPDFLTETAELLYKEGISIDIDTCGYARREVFDRIIPFTDTFLYDIKAFDSRVHKKCTGRGNEMILENLRYLVRKQCKIEVRYPYVVGYNDSECDQIGAFLAQLGGISKVKVLGYHGFADSKYEALGMVNTLPDVRVTAADVEKAVEILRGYGLNAVNGMVED